MNAISSAAKMHQKRKIEKWEAETKQGLAPFALFGDQIFFATKSHKTHKNKPGKIWLNSPFANRGGRAGRLPSVLQFALLQQLFCAGV
jgi:hypothetical protein